MRGLGKEALGIAGRALAVGVALWTAACGGTEGGGGGQGVEDPAGAPRSTLLDAPADTVVAEDRLGPLRWGEVDAFALSLGPERRWPGTGDPAGWLRELTRRAAFDRLLLEEAERLGLGEDTEVRRLDRALRRMAYSNAYLASRAVVEPPTEDEIARLYEDQKERFQAPERRKVFNIFLRFEGRDREDVLRELEAIRGRVLAGESFESLARELSESETRHRGGEIGFVSRGHFSEDFDELVFGLQPEVPSPVVSTAAGAHLFLVSIVLEARNFSLEDARPLLEQELLSRVFLKTLGETASAVPEFAEVRRLPAAEVASALQTGHPDAVVFTLGEFELTVDQFRRELELLTRQLGAARPPELAEMALDEIVFQEVIYQHVLKESDLEVPTEELEQAQRRQLADLLAERKLEAWVGGQDHLVRQHYERNAMRFALPPRLDVSRLGVPKGPGALDRLTRLEQAVGELDAGAVQLETLAASLGGRVESLGARTPAQLAARDAGAVPFLTRLRAGEHSPPFQTGEELVILRIDGRREPEERPLAAVRPAVVRSLVEQQGAELFAEMRAEMLQEASFQLDEGAIAELLGG
ncbi:MAG: peptidyl-prolyl cis-trans isomerase [Acidobacteriota bacterium]